MYALLYLSDNLIEILGAKNAATGAFINNATVDVTLVDKNGANVTGQVWPMNIPYVSGSNGDYRATLASTLTVIKGGEYTARVNFNGGLGLRRYTELPIHVIADGGKA